MNVERFKVICLSFLVLYSSSSVATLIGADKHLEGRKTEKENVRSLEISMERTSILDFSPY